MTFRVLMGALVSNLKTAQYSSSGLCYNTRVVKGQILVAPGTAINNFCSAIKAPLGTERYIPFNSFIYGCGCKLLSSSHVLFIFLNKETLSKLHLHREFKSSS